MNFIPKNAGLSLEQIAESLNEMAESELLADDWDFADIRPGDIPFAFAQMYADRYYEVITAGYRHEDDALDAEYEFEHDALACYIWLGGVRCERIGPELVKHRVVVRVELETTVMIAGGTAFNEKAIEDALDDQLPFAEVRRRIARGDGEHLSTTVYSAHVPDAVIMESYEI